MDSLLLPALAALQLLEQELLYFAAFWFVLGAVDEFAVDCVWLGVQARRRWLGEESPILVSEQALSKPIAVFVAAWQESNVIGAMVGHALQVWPQRDLRLYVGCYGNDPATVAAAMTAAAGDSRLRIVIHDTPGPTTKADCLNRVYRAMCQDEQQGGVPYGGVVLHDAEDMVHPQALLAIDAGLADADFVQLPVLPEPQPRSPWVAGHYSDEFAEAHGKTLVVRDALRAPIPAAGVGCGFGRERLAALARMRGPAGRDGPFAAECLTEDYELYGVQDKTYYVGKIFIPTWQLVLRPTARCGLQPFHIIIAANAVRRRQNWWIADWPLSNGRPRKAVARSGSTPKDTELPYPECGGVAEWRNGVLIDRCPQ